MGHTSHSTLLSGPAGATTHPSRARYQSVVSCVSCRQKKLRCDRNEPCSNCTTRGILCSYTSTSQARSSVQKHQGNRRLADRIRHLETLVGALAAEHRKDEQPSQTPAAATDKASLDGFATQPSVSYVSSSIADTQSLEHRFKEQSLNNVGRMTGNSAEAIYVSPSHWAAICDDIYKVKAYIEEDDTDFEAPVPDDETFDGPLLLGGLSMNCSLDTVLAGLPPKAFADRLVYRYTGENDSAHMVIHTPTFEAEYEKFWTNQYTTPLPWISLLYGVMAVGISLYLRSGEQVPGGLGTGPNVISTFHKLSTDCLILSNYSQPTTYTLEALILNAHCEFFRSPDSQLGVWVMSGIITRLAMRLGYHRDPSQLPKISVFQGEMRRRAWLVFLQMDVLLSSLLGLPRMILESQYDTLPPSNLLDSDFGKDSTSLPPSRPENEPTPISYSIVKGRLMIVLGHVYDLSSSVHQTTYKDVMDLDRRNNEAYLSIPDQLLTKDVHAGTTRDPASLIMRRYNIALLFQKTRCVLHRNHMMKAQQDSEYMYSRVSCVDGAMKLLELQAAIHRDVQDGGVLFGDRWFVSSLEHHNFLLAAMLVCLELNFSFHVKQDSPRLVDELGRVKYTREEMLQALQRSQQIWNEEKAYSKVALRASNVLSDMLRNNVYRQLDEEDSSSISTQSDPGSLPLAFAVGMTPQAFQTPNGNKVDGHVGPMTYPNTLYTPQDFGVNSDMYATMGPQTGFGFPTIQNAVDIPHEIDWEAWDSYMYNMPMSNV